MAPSRIDLADPSEEGSAIAEALRTRGYHVVERSIDSLREGTDAALVLLAGDDAESVDALTALKDTAENVPIVLLGLPDDAGDREVTAIRPLGADAHYARPVSIERLVRKVETLLSPPETRLAPPAVLDGVDAPSRPSREPTFVQQDDDGWSPPESTMSLAGGQDADGADDADAPDEGDDEGDRLEDLFEEEVSVEVSGVAEVTGVSFKDEILSIEEALRAHDPDNPVSQVARRADSRPPTGEVLAILSPRLTKIFREADRRVFPDSPPLDLDLPDRREPARELVPDALLEVVAMPAESREEDPLEAFTYVGVVPPELVGAPLPPPEAAQRFQPPAVTGEGPLPPARPARTEAAGVSRPSRPPATFAQADSFAEAAPKPPSMPRSPSPPPDPPLSDGIGEPTRDEPTRENIEQHGVVDGAEVLPFLMSIARIESPIDVHLKPDDASPLELTIAGGRLTRLVADVHVRALAELHRQGRVDEAPTDEARAASLLDSRISAGLVGRFEADRVVRRAREARIHELVSARSVSYDVLPATSYRGGDPGLLSSPLEAVLAEGARRRVDEVRFRELFGGGPLVLDVREGLVVAADALGLEPEIAQAVERHDGASIDVFLGAAPADEGLAGALLSLAAVDVVRVRARSADLTGILDPVDAVRVLIESAHALALDGCYFDVLGASPDALSRELRAAYEARRAELSRIDLAVHGLERLAAQHQEAIEVVDEAWEVLRDEALNRAYRKALGL